MHEHFCVRHIQVYRDLGWDCWVVERDRKDIVGSVEVLYATEPEPFGRYAHLEILELASGFGDAEVEEWILDECESRARGRGFDRFWCRPVGSGGSPEVLDRRGYTERLRQSWLRIVDLDRIEPPPFDASPLTGDYDAEASHLRAIDHRESAAYRWRYLWRPVLTPEASDFPTDVSFSGRSITLPDRRPASVLANIWRWRDPDTAWADPYVSPALAADGGADIDQVTVAPNQAAAMGATPLEGVGPEARGEPGPARFEATIVPLEHGDPWLLRELAATP
ncbi:MAG: hypothetical protein F4Y97_01135 [Dehalococcoidia bacterium]|nr:hypothetical protein [Dehalococcoidia bacterium]